LNTTELENYVHEIWRDYGRN